MVLEGLRATHQPSPWIGDYGHLVVMPQTGPLRAGAGERASGYGPQDAAFLPHYFRADLIQGSERRFFLSEQPPARRRSTPEELPFSLTPAGPEEV
jgi:putative alpha-1,2-mannosidase